MGADTGSILLIFSEQKFPETQLHVFLVNLIIYHESHLRTQNLGLAAWKITPQSMVKVLELDIYHLGNLLSQTDLEVLLEQPVTAIEQLEISLKGKILLTLGIAQTCCCHMLQFRKSFLSLGKGSLGQIAIYRTVTWSCMVEIFKVVILILNFYFSFEHQFTFQGCLKSLDAISLFY